MKILVADDHRLIVEDLCDELSRIVPDALCMGVSEPEKVVETFEYYRFDVVFMDIDMPGANGIDLAKHILDLEPRTNIIYITGYSEYALDSYETYASAFLVKPISAAKLKEALSNLRHPVSSITDDMIAAEYSGNAQIGKRIMKFREERNMTRDQLAEQMLVTVQTVSRWESGKRMPDVITFMKLAKVLAVDPGKLISDA